MLIDATQRFAQRTADWLMNDPNVKGEALIKRLALFPDSHATLIAKASARGASKTRTPSKSRTP